MISAPIAKAVDFSSQRQEPRQAAKPSDRSVSWLARLDQRMQRRQLADAACLIH